MVPWSDYGKSNTILKSLTTYSAHCSELSVSVLRELIGRTVFEIYAPNLQIAGPHLTAPSLSIPLRDQIGEGWVHSLVIIRCDWFETPKSAQ